MRRRAPHVARADTRNLTFNQQPRQGRARQGKAGQASTRTRASAQVFAVVHPHTHTNTQQQRSCHLLCSTGLAVAFILIEIKSKCFHSQNEIVRSALFLKFRYFFVFDSIPSTYFSQFFGDLSVWVVC